MKRKVNPSRMRGVSDTAAKWWLSQAGHGVVEQEQTGIGKTTVSIKVRRWLASTVPSEVGWRYRLFESKPRMIYGLG